MKVGHVVQCMGHDYVVSVCDLFYLFRQARVSLCQNGPWRLEAIPLFLSFSFFFFFFWSLPSAVTAWCHSFCVISDNTHTHTHTQGLDKTKWKGRTEENRRDGEKESTLHPLIASLKCPSGLHYPGIWRNLSCLLLKTCKKCLLKIYLFIYFMFLWQHEVLQLG